MNTQIYAEVTEWIVKNRAGPMDLQDKRRFDEWLRESPQHVRAYLEMCGLWEDLACLDPRWNPAAEELIARARAEDNVLELSTPADHSLPARSVASFVLTIVSSMRRRSGYALCAAVLVLAAGVWLYDQRNTFSTGIGEQQSIVLNDGSTIDLNAHSRVRVRYSATQRNIDLLDGQAFFHVAKNANRPFLVHSDATLVRAVGTQFDVYKRSTSTVVTVIEGRIAVAFDAKAPPLAQMTAQEAMGSARYVDAGEQLVVTASSMTIPKPANIVAATAWKSRNLVFDAASLTDVAVEFNRYNKRQLVILSPQLQNLHVSGVFSSADPALLLRFLRAQSDLVVEEADEEIRVWKK